MDSITLQSISRLLKPAPIPDVPLCADDPRFGHLIRSAIKHNGNDNATVVVVVGVPQDIGVRRNGGRPGCAQAPSAVRHSLWKLGTAGVTEATDSGRLVMYDAGDVTTEGMSLEDIHEAQHAVLSAILAEGWIPIVIGGGHDCAWPMARALNTNGKRYGVINVDAHADVRDYNDGPHSGSSFRQMLEASPCGLSPDCLVQFGLQTTTVSAQHLQWLQQKQSRIMMLDVIRHAGLTNTFTEAMTIATRDENSLYVSFDIDAVASAYAPGASAAAADGFSAADAISICRLAGTNPALAAFDIVEVNPQYDSDSRTAKLAAVLIAAVVEGIAWRRDPPPIMQRDDLV